MLRRAFLAGCFAGAAWAIGAAPAFAQGAPQQVPAAAAFIERLAQRAIEGLTAREIDNEVRRILDEAREKARSIVRENRAVIEAMAAALLEKETLDGPALHGFLSQVTRSGPVVAV